MIDYLRCRFGEGGRGVIAKSQDTGIGNLLREEVFEPEGICLWVGPGVNGIAAQTVNRDNAVVTHDRSVYHI